MTRHQLRRAWFQVHKWLGLILMAVLMPLALSGSLLLAHDWLGEQPASPPVAPPLPLSAYVAAAVPALPAGTRLAGIALPTQDHPDAVTVRAVRAAPGGAGPRGPEMPVRVRLDARTAAVQPSHRGGEGGGFWMVMHRFHGSLLIPGWGRPIVGWFGIAMLVSSLSGLWLWWPTVTGFLRGLRWRRGRDFDFNLHHMAGFWIALPLAVLSLSGAWISFPRVTAPLVGETMPQRPGGGPGGNQPLPAPAQPIDAVAALARTQGALADLQLPTAGIPRWTATLAGGRRVAIEDATGALARAERPRQGPVMRWMRLIHSGTEETGPVWRAIVFVGGIIPVVLGITGFTMWIGSRSWRRRAAQAKAAKRQRVSA